MARGRRDDEPRRSPKRANPGRLAAARALLAVDEGVHVDAALDRWAPSEGPDRRLAWHLVLTVLRRRSTLDAALAPFLRRPLHRLDPPVRAALRVGAADKLLLRTKTHAAVHQAVEVTRGLGAHRATGLVNAVLRRVALVDDLPRAAALDHPDWLVGRWDDRYGEQATTGWCLRNNTAAPLTLVARDDAAYEALADAVDAKPVDLGGSILERVLTLERHREIEAIPGYADGWFWVQDPASVRVADLAVRGLPEGARVLDACAAPGGKALRLASAGVQVVAADNSEARLERLRENIGRVGLDVAVRRVDWTDGDATCGGPFDAVLVDAPCSGLGTTRRHPDIRWRRTVEDLPQRAALQRTILARAATQVAPGGVLVYAVCSPEPEEGAEVVSWFVERHHGFVLEEELRTAPPAGDEDAFYAARLVRSS